MGLLIAGLVMFDLAFLCGSYAPVGLLTIDNTLAFLLSFAGRLLLFVILGVTLNHTSGSRRFTPQ